MAIKKTTKEWVDYVQFEADNSGLPFNIAWLLFQTLGPDEAYDGFLTELYDLAKSEQFD